MSEFLSSQLQQDSVAMGAVASFCDQRQLAVNLIKLVVKLGIIMLLTLCCAAQICLGWRATNTVGSPFMVP